MRRNGNGEVLGVVVTIVLTLGLVPRAQALPRDPDNAALLYYQAFLMLDQLDDEARDLIARVAKGEADPNDTLREYLQECQEAIELAEVAVKLPTCDWGLRFSQGFDTPIGHLRPARLLVFVLVADARVRTAEGDHKGALERCLMTTRLARHVGNDTVISYLVSLAARNIAYRCIQDVVGQATDDAELLEWLKRELATSLKQTVSLIRAVEIDKEMVLDLLRMEKIESLARFYAEDDEMMQKWIIALSNEMVLDFARKFYTERITTVLSILNHPMSYERAFTELKELGLYFKPLPDLIGTMTNAFLPAFATVYSLKTRTDSHANALGAGVEVCLLKAKSGELPAVLPDGLPQDPFSGEDFHYERTDDGFVLRCRAKDLGEEMVHEYVFTLK